jgi:hypothetical protein
LIVSPIRPDRGCWQATDGHRVSGELQRLLSEVLVARQQRIWDRSRPGVERDFADGRQRLRIALENYTRALDASSLPVPYRVRDELRLAQGCEPRRLRTDTDNPVTARGLGRTPPR